MRLSIITGALVALLTGIAIAVQSTMTSRVGGIIGDIRTGILTNTLGGIAAGSLMLIWLLREGPEVWKVPPVVIGVTALSGILGVLIITGISFSLQRAGVAAGLARQPESSVFWFLVLVYTCYYQKDKRLVSFQTAMVDIWRFNESGCEICPGKLCE